MNRFDFGRYNQGEVSGVNLCRRVFLSVIFGESPIPYPINAETEATNLGEISSPQASIPTPKLFN